MELQKMSAETIARLECLVAHIGGPSMCDPHCEAVDSSICQFIMYVMRDVLRYLGLTQERMPSQEYKVCAYKQKYFLELEAQLKAICN
jgi:hypothetical protein